MADTGWKDPSAEGLVYNQWDNGENAYSSNDEYATADQVFEKNDYYNFDFGLPAEIIIDGIEVHLEAKTGWIVPYGVLRIRLSWDGGSNWTSVYWYIDPLATSDTDYYMAGDGFFWGRSWSKSEFDDGNFLVHANAASCSITRPILLDHIQVKVYYHLGVVRTKTIQSKAGIKLVKITTTQAKANVKQSNITKTISAKAQTHMFVELFNSNTYKDAGETDADWNLSLGKVYLPGA